MRISTHCYHIAFFSKDCLRFEAIESFLQRKTSKLLTDFCVSHQWVRVIRHSFHWVYFSLTIVHLQICDLEKLRKVQAPEPWNMVAVGIPCQLANNQRKNCLSFPKLKFNEHRWPIHCLKWERFSLQPYLHATEPTKWILMVTLMMTTMTRIPAKEMTGWGCVKKNTNI